VDRFRESSRTENHNNLMTEFTIKQLEVQEVASVAALFKMQLAEHDVRRSADELVGGLKTLLVEPQQGFVLSAVSDGKPVGVAYAARILSLEHGGWSGWLDELYVSPTWRGQGVGSALLAAVVAGATERGWAALDLEVDSNHRRVIPLYARNRFQPVRRTRFVRRLNAE
jgi:GNAT superfamily N-acetyltransferase